MFGFNFFKGARNVKVLTYHGIVDQNTNNRLHRNFHTRSQFKEQLEYLIKQGFAFLNATDLLHFTTNSSEYNKYKFACITFDDGYKNNITAIEMLENKKLSGTFFISTETIGSNVSIWTVNLSLLLLEGNINSIVYNDEELSLHNYTDRLITFSKIRIHLKSLDSDRRAEAFSKIVRQFPKDETERLIHEHPEFTMFSWKEIQGLESQNIQFHSHGHSHEILHKQQLTQTIKTEITLSKKIMEEKLKNEISLFAYPNGDYTPIADEYLIASGYKAALSLDHSAFTKDVHQFFLPRITPDHKISKFKHQVKQ